jgi:predicted O-methyltransferase YrrM
MASEPRTGAMLRVLASSKPGGRFLELGTGTGISTAWLLDGMSNDARLTTVDNDAGMQSVARNILGHDSRLNIVTADGMDFLRHQTADSYDFIFADAVPGKYEALNEALALLRKGGLYIVDDMLAQPNWPETHSAKVPTLLSNLFARSGFSAVSMAWSSGLVILARNT